jgi:predicted ArsR family transcriptional regulator
LSLLRILHGGSKKINSDHRCYARPMGERWPAVAALLDQVRRALYEYVRRQDHPVSREEAASSQSISRGLAAFHLDKLVEVGLLKARTDQPSHRRSRGRRPKVYEPSGEGLALTIPQRRYDLVGEILVDAAADGSAEHRSAVVREARRRGAAMGETMCTARFGDPDLPGDAVGALQSLGFEPQRVDSTVILRNCPFHTLAMRQTELVCAMNLAFIGGLLAGAGIEDQRAVLMPGPPSCCVQLQDTAQVAAQDTAQVPAQVPAQDSVQDSARGVLNG